MIQSLRQAKSRRGVRRTTAAARSFVPENQRIAYRPEDIERRLVPGHWEGDFIKGAYNREKFLHKPLPYSEVKSVAKSVAKWVWRNFPTKAFSALQSKRGKRGGRPRTTTQNGKPWEALGISRATWYRKRKKGQLPANS